MSALSPRPWAAADYAADGSGEVRLFDRRDDLVCVLSPDQARDLAHELLDVASYADGRES